MAKPINRLSIRDLKVSNEKDRSLLEVASFDLPEGETLGVTGPSGAGKSTFLHALAGLHSGVSGFVHWGDLNLVTAKEAQSSKFRRNNLGLIFQDFLLFDEMGPNKNSAIQSLFQPKAARSSIRANAQNLLAKLKVSRSSGNVSTYSGGERQRISVARSLAHDPSILLADEPTANLDRAAADSLASELIELAKTRRMTLIVVSHDEAILKQMDKVATISDGVLQ